MGLVNELLVYAEQLFAFIHLKRTIFINAKRTIIIIIIVFVRYRISENVFLLVSFFCFVALAAGQNCNNVYTFLILSYSTMFAYNVH
jgi:hypothetical protein